VSSVTPPGTPPAPSRYPAVRGPAARGGPGGGYPSGIGYRSRAGSFRRRADRMRGFEIHSVSHDRRFRAVSALVRYSLGRAMRVASGSGGPPSYLVPGTNESWLIRYASTHAHNHAHAPAQSRPRNYTSGCVALDDRQWDALDSTCTPQHSDDRARTTPHASAVVTSQNRTLRAPTEPNAHMASRDTHS
jgi:hypothetical protein